MDTMLLMLAFITFFGLVAAWLLLPSTTAAASASAPTRVVSPGPASVRV